MPSHHYHPSSLSLNQSHSFASKLILLLAVLPLSLAALAFLLQWKGDDSLSLADPAISSPQSNHEIFPGMESSVSLISPSKTQQPGDCSSLTRSGTSSLPLIRNWTLMFESNLKPKICVVSSTSSSLDQILPWMFYHKVIGVTNFILFVEGKAASPSVSKVLELIPGVKLVYRTKELEEKQAKSRVWNETWLASFFYKPCNYELFVKQSLNMEMAIVMARDAGMDWIFHLDTDELVHPAGGREYSLRQLLHDVPADVDIVIFPNYESAVERDNVKDPFVEVSMFKRNYDHLPKDTYFGMYKESVHGNPNYFLTYGNGKSAARVQEHLRPNGAHRWHNYMKTPKEIKMDEAAVLHYTYAKFSDLSSRRDRCSCKPTKEDVKRCFMLEFDRAAFIIASTAAEDEMRNWYREHVVWMDKEVKLKLLRKGVLTRIHDPMVIIQSLRESGVFSDIIASAPTSNQSLPSVGANNSAISVSQKMKDHQTAASRKIFESQIANYQEAAVPPSSPPGISDSVMET